MGSGEENIDKTQKMCTISSKYRMCHSFQVTTFQKVGFDLQNRQIYIADTNHDTILLSVLEKEIISTQLFNRLHNISQNSTAYLTFPANRTKRFEHSLGTMKLCGDILYYGVSNAENGIVSDFLLEFKKIL